MRTRAAYTQQSRIVDLEGTLLADVLTIERYLINGVELKIALTPNSPEFLLMSSVAKADYKIELVDATLKLCLVHVASPILLAHEKVLSSGKLAHYPYMKSELKSFAIPTGHYEFTLDNAFLSRVPVRMVVAFVDAAALNGSYAKNPFNFHHYNLSDLSITLDDEPVPSKAMKVVMKSRQLDSNFNDAYMAMFRTQQDVYSGGSSNGITRTSFMGGYALFVVDLEAEIQSSKSTEAYFPKVKAGNVRVSVNFAQAVTSTVNMLLYASFPGDVTLDEQRNVLIG